VNKVLWEAKLFKDWKVFMVKNPKEPDGPPTPMAVNTLMDKRGRNTTFMDLVLFGDLAEQIVDQTGINDYVEVKGFLTQRKFLDKKTGTTRTSYSVNVQAWRKVTPESEWDPDEDAPFLEKKRKPRKGGGV